MNDYHFYIVIKLDNNVELRYIDANIILDEEYITITDKNNRFAYYFGKKSSIVCCYYEEAMSL